MMRAAATVVSCLAAVTAAQGGSEPNPPMWPSSVKVFTPSTPNISGIVNTIYNENGGRLDNGQFSPDRFALLFMPGIYDVDVPVGYYTQVLGLGAAPTDVVFTGQKGVYCEEGEFNIATGALDTFWRGALPLAPPACRRRRACHAGNSPANAPARPGGYVGSSGAEN